MKNYFGKRSSLKAAFPLSHAGKISLTLSLLPNNTAGHYITFNGTGFQLLNRCLHPDGELTLSPSGGDLKRQRQERIQKKGKLLKRKALSSDEISLQRIKAWSENDPISETKGHECSTMQMTSH